MMKLQIGNAPCSWGLLEFEGLEAGESIGHEQMLDELAATGYRGTELGDWGYMPTDPKALHETLARRDLTLLGAFVPVALKNADAHTAGELQAVKTASLLAAVRDLNGQDHAPFLVLADENGTIMERTQHAGRITTGMGLSEAQWVTFSHGAEQVARAVKTATGLATVFHHHCAGYVETPEEIAQLMDRTDPKLLGLVFDAGHYIYGSGPGTGQSALEGLNRFADRIHYLHFKDCHPEIADACRAEECNYFEAIRRGVFCELGQGCVEFPAIINWLKERSYEGWALVEQDVLPGMGAPAESARRSRDYLLSIGV